MVTSEKCESHLSEPCNRMAVNLRLSLLRLRQKINFRLMRILLVFLYMAITASVLIYHFQSASEPLEELVVAEVKGARASRGAEFILTGGQDEDFRRNGFQVSKLTHFLCNLLRLETGHKTIMKGRSFTSTEI